MPYADPEKQKQYWADRAARIKEANPDLVRAQGRKKAKAYYVRKKDDPAFAISHNEKQKRHRDKQRASGKCKECKLDALPGQSKCVVHKWRSLAESAGLERKTGAEFLKRKFSEQNGKCAYSGVPLVLGDNLSVDHIVPKSSPHFPGNTEDNIVLCDFDVNIAKNNLSMEKFRAMIVALYCHLNH